jgi:hypothetical protein
LHIEAVEILQDLKYHLIGFKQLNGQNYLKQLNPMSCLKQIILLDIRV